MVPPASALLSPESPSPSGSLRSCESRGSSDGGTAMAEECRMIIRENSFDSEPGSLEKYTFKNTTDGNYGGIRTPKAIGSAFYS